MSSMTLSTKNASGVTVPLTTPSPTPGAASTAIFERSPLAGLSVIATPAARAGTMCWTATAISGASRPLSRRYAKARPVFMLPQHRSTWRMTSSAPLIHR
jgi:hypothetical protein